MPFFWYTNAKKHILHYARTKMHKTKKVTTTFFFLKFFPCKRSNDGVLVVKAAAMSNSTTRLTWHFSHVPSKQNRVYGPCFYLDYAPQAAKLHQSSTNFLLGLSSSERKRKWCVAQKCHTMSSWHFSHHSQPYFWKNIYWQATRNFGSQAWSCTHFKLVKHYIWPQLRRQCNRSLQSLFFR